MPDFIRAFKTRAIIGKGGMNNEVLSTMQDEGCVYLAGVSGCAAYYTQGVENTATVYFEEWGSDRVVKYELKGLGPLLVTMDARGNTLYEEVERKKKAAIRDILSNGTE
jgi:fumarate hydratase subunit beta